MLPETADIVQGAILGGLAVLVAFASWIDVRHRRIPNWVTVITLCLGLIHVAIAAGWDGTLWALAHVACALVMTMILFATGVIGAGDAKFYAAVAGWLPLPQGFLLLTSVALSGLVLVVLFFALRGRGGRGNADPQFAKLPYGVAIGIGGLIAVGAT